MWSELRPLSGRKAFMSEASELSEWLESPHDSEECQHEHDEYSCKFIMRHEAIHPEGSMCAVDCTECREALVIRLCPQSRA